MIVSGCVDLLEAPADVAEAPLEIPAERGGEDRLQGGDCRLGVEGASFIRTPRADVWIGGLQLARDLDGLRGMRRSRGRPLRPSRDNS